MYLLKRNEDETKSQVALEDARRSLAEINKNRRLFNRERGKIKRLMKCDDDDDLGLLSVKFSKDCYKAGRLMVEL